MKKATKVTVLGSFQVCQSKEEKSAASTYN